jgi:hypothetical protein
MDLEGVEILWPREYYDGPLDGLASFAGREYWFVAVASPAGRRFSLHELTGAELEDEHRLHRLFEELVGPETCFHLGSGERPYPAHPNRERFFEIQRTYKRPDYSSRPVVGYFTTAGFPAPLAWLQRKGPDDWY